MRFDSQLSRMICQMFSTGLSSGHFTCDDVDVGEHLEFAGCMPSSLIHQYERVRTRRDGERYLGKVQRHGVGVTERQDEPGTLGVLRADRTVDVGRFGPLVLCIRKAGYHASPSAA